MTCYRLDDTCRSTAIPNRCEVFNDHYTCHCTIAHMDEDGRIDIVIDTPAVSDRRVDVERMMDPQFCAESERLCPVPQWSAP